MTRPGASPTSTYKQIEYSSAGKGKLVLMLYEAAIKFLDVSVRSMDERNIAQKGLYLGRATDVVGELRSSLNFKDGQEIALLLDRLYDYMIWRLWRANLQSDKEAVLEVKSLLETLHEAWREVVAKSAQTGAGAPPRSREGGLQFTA